MFTNNFRLDELAVMAAKSAGFDGEISAEFRHFETAKAFYEKHHDYLRIELADYLQTAPEDVILEALTRTINHSRDRRNGKPSKAYMKWFDENRYRWEVKV